MAADSNMGFHQGMVPSSFYNRHMVSFQSGSSSNSNRITPTGMNSIGVANGTTEVIYTGSPGGDNMSLAIPCGNTAGVLHLDPLPGLKHDTGLAVDWSLEEQSLLEKGLIKYADEPNIMKYIKIAFTLQNKTIRDVALRCRWMTNKENGKWRKQDDYSGKKVKDRKEKQVECSPRGNVISSQLPNIPAGSFMMHRVGSNNGIACEAPSIDIATQLLLEENAQVLCQIQCNLDTLKKMRGTVRLTTGMKLVSSSVEDHPRPDSTSYSANVSVNKLQDNIDLFLHTKNNTTTILNRMSEMPGIMSQMPPLPDSINDELVNTMLLGAPQAMASI